MTTVRQESRILNQTTSVGSKVTLEYTANEDSFSSDSLEISSTPTALDLGTIQTPRFYQLRLLSGDDVEVSDDGGSNYRQLLSGADDCLVIRPNFKDYVEISAVVAEADVSGSLSGDYFDIYDVDGAVRVWFDVDGGSSAPATPAGGRLVEVDIATDDTAATIAAAIVTAFASDTSLTVTASTATVTFTDKFVGTRTDVADGTTGWLSFSVTQQGAALPSVFVQSAGSSLMLATIAPN